MQLANLKNKSGLTLVELLIVLALLSLITSMIFSFFIQGTKIYSMGARKSEIHQDTSIAAFSISNAIRNASEIKLSSIPGYSQMNINSKYPDINQVEYTITQEGGIYSLNFTLTHQEGYSIDSKILLDNIKSAELGSGNEVWFLTPEAMLHHPTISVGSGTGTIIEGLGGSITYPVTTMNIGNGQSVVADFISPQTGLSLSTNAIYNGTTTITVNANPTVNSGLKVFSVNYSGASERLVSFMVSENIPVIVLDDPIYLNFGESFDPLYDVRVYSASGNNITSTSTINVGGDTVNINTSGEYTLIYNVTVGGIPADEVVRKVIVGDHGGINLVDVLDGITTLTVSNPGNKNNQTKPKINLPSYEGISFEFVSATTEAPAVITIPGGVVTRDTGNHGKDCSGTITLQASADGHSATKVFYVFIPKDHGTPGNVMVSDQP